MTEEKKDFWWRIPWNVLAKRPGGIRYNQVLTWLENEHNEAYNHWVSIENDYRKDFTFGNYARILTWLEEEYIELFIQWKPVLKQIEVESEKSARELARKRGWVK